MKEKRKKQILYYGLALLGCISLSACSTWSDSISGQEQVSNSSVVSYAGVEQENVASVDWSKLPKKEVTLSDEGLQITEGGTYVLTGTTEKGVVIDTTEAVRLVLAGVTISNSDSAAIYISAAEMVEIELQEGTKNIVQDSKNRSDSDIDSAIYADSDLAVTGQGELTVTGNFKDGVVSSKDLLIRSGSITVTATNDGIVGKDSLVIKDGQLDVIAGGDGLKSSNDTDEKKGYTTIVNGNIQVDAGDDGIKAETALTVESATIVVTQSTEALEGGNVTINGGNLDIFAIDDAVNAASSSDSTDIFIKVTGGDLKVAVAAGDTDAFDSNGNLYISGGNIEISAQSAFDFDGIVEWTGGTVVVNGETITQITATGPGNPSGW